MAPFGIAILASLCSNSVPMGVVYLLTCIGSFVGFGKDVFLSYLLMSLLFFVSVIVIRPKKAVSGERKEVGLHLAGVCLLVQLGKLFLGTFLVYDLLQAFLFTIMAGVFYKIFSGCIIVIRDFGIKKAFSVEEVIGASLIFALAVAGLKELTIFSFSIRTILSILIVMIMGWQNGVLVGATAGVTIGVTIGILATQDPILLAAYAICGMLSGLLSRLGKIGTVVGFVLGNGILAYATKGNTILFQEILIASIGLLAVPNKIKIQIEDLYGKTKLLPVGATNRLEQNQDAIQRLNSVSEAISEVAQSYKQVAATVIEEETSEERQNQIVLQTEIKQNLQGLEENILYEELIEEENGILEDLCRKVIEKNFIDNQDILSIFEKHNSYLVGFGEDQVYQEQIREIVKTINYSYRISKVNFVWKKKVEEKKKTMGTQLDGISKAISSLAENMEIENAQNETGENQKEVSKIRELLKQKQIIAGDITFKKEANGKLYIHLYIETCKQEELEECKAEKIERLLSRQYGQKLVLQKQNCPIREQKEVCDLLYCSEDRYKLQLGMARTTKANSTVSGDCDLEMKLKDGKYLLAISDGMGSGPEARKSSTVAIKMLKRLLCSGFDKQTSVEFINSSLCLNSEEDMYATLDTAVLDLYQGNMEFIKNGACPTYIKNRRNVEVIKAISLPTGILAPIELTVFDHDIQEGDMLVMCSDGILEANTEYENKELWLKYLLEEIETDNVQKIADIILKEAIDYNYGVAKDDMTVLVTKIMKKQ